MQQRFSALQRMYPSVIYRRALSSAVNCSLMTVPLTFGQPHAGADIAPIQLINSGLLKQLKRLGWNVEHIPEVQSLKNIPSPSVAAIDNNKFNAKNCDYIGKVSHDVFKSVESEAAKDNFLLILGGDHSIPIGTIPGIMKKRPNTGIVWVDAHADINTPNTSSSGNMHGMPLGFLLGLFNHLQLPSFQWFQPCLKPSDIVYIGLRDLDAPEKVAIKQLGIKAYTMYDIDRLGINKVMEEVIEHHKDRDSIHLSYDIDAIDPIYAPHTGTTVRGGLTFREGNYVCEALAATGKLKSMELVEVNPSLSPELDSKVTIDMSLTLIGSAMGSTIL